MTLTPTQETERRGETGARLRADLRSQIESGRFVGGEFLPTVRELSTRYGVARKTVNRALKTLEAEGLLSAEPRQGYRVMARAGDPDRGCPIAMITRYPVDYQNWPGFMQDMHAGLQAAAAKRDWSLLPLCSEGKDPKSIMRQLGAARTCGLVVDAIETELLQAARRAGLPVVVIDSWYEDMKVNTVIQDSFLGGLLAATHLVKRGRKRIAWCGAFNEEMHTMMRLSGARCGLERAGLDLPREMMIVAPEEDIRETARKVLGKPDRPDAIIALWHGVADQVVAAAREAGLVPGRDIEVVGWMTDARLVDGQPLFDGDCPQPAVVWSPALMADLAVERLEALRRNPDLPAVRTMVPVELKLPGSESERG
jgi:DNA-binding LacI/PurR family transcriptional regulator